MADRRATALDELAIAVAEATVDAWLDGKLATDGSATHNDKGTGHASADKSKAPAKRRVRAKATKGLRNVRRSCR
jgi:hypothetical protein